MTHSFKSEKYLYINDSNLDAKYSLVSDSKVSRQKLDVYKILDHK